MRFPSALAALLAAAMPFAASAAADAVRAELQARLGGVQGEAPVMQPAVAAPVLAEGKALFTRKFKSGRSLATCFPNGGKRVAAGYPLYDARQKRVVTLETAINQCLKTHNEPLYEPGDAATMGAVVAYVRSLSEKQKAAVRVPAAAEEKFEAGRRLHASRLGQRNYACASCHVQNAGKRYDGEVLSAATVHAARSPAIRDGKALTLQARMRECLERMGAAPFPAGSEELNVLEYFLAVVGNGQPLQPNAPRER